MLKQATQNGVNSINLVELQINQYKKISDQIKELEAMRDKVKQELLNGYFATNQEYVNENGRVLATYKSHDREQFNTTRFKADHGDIYKMYSEQRTVFSFLVK